MGIRPQFQIIVGIDDATDNDPRHIPPDEEWLEDIYNFRKLTEEECWKKNDSIFNDFRDTDRQISSILYNPHFTDEFAVKNVQGVMTYEGKYDDNVIRALATLDNKYLECGYERIPTLDPATRNLLYRHAGYTQEDVECNRFVDSYFENLPAISRMHWQRAVHYLGLVGWTVKETELRYLLVWDWG